MDFVRQVLFWCKIVQLKGQFHQYSNPPAPNQCPRVKTAHLSLKKTGQDRCCAQNNWEIRGGHFEQSANSEFQIGNSGIFLELRHVMLSYTLKVQRYFQNIAMSF